MNNSMAERIFGRSVRYNAALYQRAKDLPKLISVTPAEVENVTAPGTEHVIDRLRKVCRALHWAALRDHWSYDLSRHLALIAAIRAERAYLASLKDKHAAAWAEIERDRARALGALTAA